MTLHRITSRRVHAWCPMPYFEGLRTWSGRSALHILEHSAWYTRLALGSNICLRVGPLTLIVWGLWYTSGEVINYTGLQHTSLSLEVRQVAAEPLP